MEDGVVAREEGSVEQMYLYIEEEGSRILFIVENPISVVPPLLEVNQGTSYTENTGKGPMTLQGSS